ncbi:hypothetical protein [Dyella choica]|uniref:NIPSNAP domain-containing protein n=1 Tax=Dyella choica TaxID=1927959 RepID=A0A3S0SBE9_9GAMM|nr:hypothetical protein [Dyella choica]RUL78123.1 hypothetical protein EKH80_04540 [Dyella choica]
MTYRLLATVLVLLLISPASAQQGLAAHFFAYQVNPGAQARFEQGYRHHLGWHRSHRDPLVWYGWTVSDGRCEGCFIDASVGEPFAAFDHRVDIEQDGADFTASVMPFVTPQAQLAYALLPELSYGTPLEKRQPSDTVQVTYFDLRPGTELRFEHALQAARRVLVSTPGAPPHTWYRLVTGGDKPRYMLMVARTNWASYDGFRADIADLLASDQNALRDFTEAVRSSSSESWKYHPDLSNLP